MMNRTILTAIAGTVMLFTTLTNAQTIKKDAAEVNQVQGYYIFVDCKPEREYEVLGTIESNNRVKNPQYQNVRDHLINKAKETYPRGEGMIFYFNPSSKDKADIIRFKD